MEHRNEMYVLMAGYGLIVAIAATITYGIDIDLYIGLLLGIGSLMVNYWLLSYTIEAITERHKTISIFPIGLGRFLIFGIAGGLSFQQSHLCVVLFAIGILAMPVSALLLTMVISSLPVLSFFFTPSQLVTPLRLTDSR